MTNYINSILVVLLLISPVILAEDDVSATVPNTSSIEDFYNTEDGRQYLNDIIKQAEQGDASSQYQLGDQYWLGWGVRQDYAEAVKWYIRSAEQGFIGAQNSLGKIHAAGDHVEQNTDTAIKWYTQAAEQGNADAQEALGGIYASGKSGKQDFGEAALWYAMAADQNNANAQLMLATLRVKGWGVPQNDAVAFKWYEMAAEQGLAEAQKNLGVMYANGDGVTQDLKKAIHWYTLAAEQGDADAQFNLSVRYAKGQGVVENYVQAYKWTLLAGMNSYDVTENKAWLRSHMTTEQLSKAQELAKEIAPKVITPPKTMEIVIPKAIDASPAAEVSEAETENENTDYTQKLSRKTENGLKKYVSETDGFSVYFPSPPERAVVKDTTDLKIVHYRSLADGGLVQYNLFLHDFKTKKILEDKFQKAYLQSYLASRKTAGPEDILLKRELTFQRGNAVAFKQIVYSEDIEIIHEGLNFFVDGSSIVMTCAYPPSHTPLLSFDEFAKTFEAKTKDAAPEKAP